MVKLVLYKNLNYFTIYGSLTNRPLIFSHSPNNFNKLSKNVMKKWFPSWPRAITYIFQFGEVYADIKNINLKITETLDAFEHAPRGGGSSSLHLQYHEIMSVQYAYGNVVAMYTGSLIVL